MGIRAYMGDKLSYPFILSWDGQLRKNREILIFRQHRHDFFFTGRKLFGDSYSGLEYDYRGLINLYDSQGMFLSYVPWLPETNLSFAFLDILPKLWSELG